MGIERRALQTVLVVGDHPRRDELLDALAVETNGYDVVEVESIAHAYARIKQMSPDAVIMFFQMEDVVAYQVLSMLKVDAATAQIPVLTYPLPRELRRTEPDVPQRMSSGQVAGVQQ